MLIGEPRQDKTYEYIVIGSGPGGAVAASVLAEAGREVLILEEGPHLPQEAYRPFGREEMELKYRSGGLTLITGKAKISYVEGRVVGGGSEVNSGFYHRAPESVLEDWKKRYQVRESSSEDLRSHFEACEHDLGVGTSPGAIAPASRKLELGARNLGWAVIEAPRFYRFEGKTDELGAAIGSRQSMSETYLPRALDAGARLRAETWVRRIRRVAGRIWEVEVETRGERSTLRARRVIAAGGAVHTPAMLRRSAIRGLVGNSLKFHIMVKLIAEFNEKVNCRSMGVSVHQIKEFLPRLGMGCSVSGPEYLALGLLGHPEKLKELPSGWDRFAAYYSMVSCAGAAKVHTLPGFRNPLVHYPFQPEDRVHLEEAFEKLAAVLLAGGAREVYVSGERRGSVSNETELKNEGAERLWRSRPHLTSVHVFSSCPMGEDRKLCVTDSFGKVHGQEDLWISDGSLLCTAPGVNPQGTIMAIARRNALRLIHGGR